MQRLSTINDVVAARLCIGCGACAAICPDQRITLYDFAAEGIRPLLIDQASCQDCTDCLRVCPAVETDFGKRPGDDFEREWGPVIDVWEGHATDPEIRYRGSSGGALTALAAFCIEHAGIHGVLHTGPNPADPVRNQTRLSTSRAELLHAAGSRYSPASVANGLGLVETAPGPCVIIGKPGEIAAVANARKLRPKLDANVALTMSFFCAETPATLGTLDLLQKKGVSPQSVQELRYRGHGWPGYFAPTRVGEAGPAFEMTYRDSWAFLQRYRPWSVQLWPDGSGELADISCGDPWYNQPDGKNPGSSLVVVRTERGRKILQAAMAAGCLQLAPAERWKLARSQSNLLQKKGAVWGRLITMRFLRMPVPRFENSDLFHCWKALSFVDKLKSTFGTLRRIVTRKLRAPLRLDPRGAAAVNPAVECRSVRCCPHHDMSPSKTQRNS